MAEIIYFQPSIITREIFRAIMHYAVFIYCGTFTTDDGFWASSLPDYLRKQYFTYRTVCKEWFTFLNGPEMMNKTLATLMFTIGKFDFRSPIWNLMVVDDFLPTPPWLQKNFFDLWDYIHPNYLASALAKVWRNYKIPEWESLLEFLNKVILKKRGKLEIKMATEKGLTVISKTTKRWLSDIEILEMRHKKIKSLLQYLKCIQKEHLTLSKILTQLAAQP